MIVRASKVWGDPLIRVLRSLVVCRERSDWPAFLTMTKIVVNLLLEEAIVCCGCGGLSCDWSVASCGGGHTDMYPADW